MTQIGEVVAQTARALRESARSHKRMERWHRERLREEMQALSDLERACKALGIAFDLTTQGEDGGRHGRREEIGT